MFESRVLPVYRSQSAKSNKVAEECSFHLPFQHSAHGWMNNQNIHM